VRLPVIAADTRNKHKGLPGLYRLYREIEAGVNPEIIIDLHNNIRSRVLRLLFKIIGKRVISFDKGRNEKKAYIKKKNKHILKATTERYGDAFKKAGIYGPLMNTAFGLKYPSPKSDTGRAVKIGLAPFARHKAKTWPVEYLTDLLNLLSKEMDAHFYFYGGKEDSAILNEMDFSSFRTEICAGRLSPGEEIQSISRLDVFVSMDSANMHLADLIGVSVLSIWGATHPDLGFRPLNQPDGYSVQSPEPLSCRPCSVYGNKRCYLKESEYKCLISITPAMVAQKIIAAIR